jgi:nicotinate-nucleotide adenylyltransferase
MVQLAITDNPIFKLDNRELLRTGASYTIDTLISLRNELGENASLVLFMGSDAFTNFNTWHDWEKIIHLCHIALVQRSVGTMKAPLAKVLETFLHNHYTENIDDLRETNAGYVTMQSITPLDISSTAIRTNLQNKNSARYLMPDGVLDYIKSNMLYNNSAK